MARPSSRSPDLLPAPTELERLCQALAALDAVLSPDWDGRTYSFNRRWDARLGQRKASIRLGKGDEVFILFGRPGTLLKGFAAKSPIAAATPAGMFSGLPATLANALTEPAFDMEHTTFFLWNEGTGWKHGTAKLPAGDDVDGSERMLGILAGKPEDYVLHAKTRYDRNLPLEVVERIYRHEPLSASMITTLNPSVDVGDIKADLDEIGYPVRP